MHIEIDIPAFDDDDGIGEFECPECGEELDEDDECENPECPLLEDEAFLGGMNDREERQHERRQMGIP